MRHKGRQCFLAGARCACYNTHPARSVLTTLSGRGGGCKSGYAGDLCDVRPAAVQKTVRHTFADGLCTWAETKYRECCMYSDA